MILYADILSWWLMKWWAVHSKLLNSFSFIAVSRIKSQIADIKFYLDYGFDKNIKFRNFYEFWENEAILKIYLNEFESVQMRI